MRKYNNLILCEGETDQALIGSFLENTSGWHFLKGTRETREFPFQEESIWSYKKDNGDTLGIWQVGGNNFNDAIKTIMEGEKEDKFVDRVAIVTDHDDSDAEDERPQTILNTITSVLSCGELNQGDFRNKWTTISFQSALGAANIQFCYLLVPLDSVGALETFMMNSLSEQNEEKSNVILQAKEFVKNFSSQVYLRERREKVKAELGVSLSVFSPDKVFTTMKELIDSAHWENFATANTQFERLKEL